MSKACLLAAPASQQGKTSVALALLASWHRRGIKAGACKLGPDYIDSGLHQSMGATLSINLDLWAMRATLRRALWREMSDQCERIVVEGAMGLFDGGAKNVSTADAAAYLHLGVILVVDGVGMAQSAAALLEGFARHRKDCVIKGVLFNRVASARHGRYLQEAARRAGVPLLGLLPQQDDIKIGKRHLGLYQGHELDDGLAARLAAWLENNADMDAIEQCLAPASLDKEKAARDAPWRFSRMRHLAVTRDEAFSFHYDWLARQWRAAGMNISFFSPLRGEMPHEDCDGVMLVGGYPEEHLDVLPASFFENLRALAQRNIPIYGECGGFMVLGRSITDASGKRHDMAHLLAVDFSFENSQLALSYRRCRLVRSCFLGEKNTVLRGHEFHHAKITHQEGEPLFHAEDENGGWQPMGCRISSVMGSFFHVMDFEP